jgi:imidazolonepropionase-like amidohydrolase
VKPTIDLMRLPSGRWSARLAAGLSALMLWGSDTQLARGFAAIPQTAEGLQAFTVGWMYDGTEGAPVEDAVVVALDGVIVAAGRQGDVFVPPDAQVVDLGDRFLIPGLVNAHGHVSGERESALAQLRQYAHYGVTTVVSLGGETPDAFDLRDGQWNPGLDRARILVAGPVLSPGTIEEARAQVSQAAEMGADWVKIRVDDGLDQGTKMPADVYTEVITAARERDLPVAVHIVELEDALGVVRAGAELVAHSVRDTTVSQELIDQMVASEVCLVPTLMREVSTFVYAERPFFFDDPFFLDGAAPEDLTTFLTPEFQAGQVSPAAEYWKRAMPVAQRNLRTLHAAGVGIAMGTDTGPRGRFQGYFEHLELELMVQSGLLPDEVIHAATGGAAACMGLGGTVGSIEAGAWADLLVLERNPFEDILGTRAVHSVWVAGNRVR